MKDDDYNSEGLGEGWYFSILGGGERPTVDTSDRTPVTEDNTNTENNLNSNSDYHGVVPGDFAVPTVFNPSSMTIGKNTKLASNRK